MTRIVIRADAGTKVGAGHVARCMALADALRKTGAEPVFAMRQGSAEAVAGFGKGKFRRIDLPIDGDDVAPLAELTEAADLLVVDHYGWSAVQEIKLRSKARCIAVIDDLADRRHDADLLLDQSPGRLESDYVDFVPPRCRLLLGSDYALLRSEFAKARARSRKRRTPGLSRLMVSFGGVDSKNVTAKALVGIERSGLRPDIDVVMGAHAPHLATVTDMIRAMRDGGHRIRLHVDSDRMAELMTEADLALGAVGGTAWERCALGVPTIAVSLADNQQGAAAALARAGAIDYLGFHDCVDENAFARALISFADNPEKVGNMSRNAAAICDGGGAMRVAKAMMELIA